MGYVTHLPHLQHEYSGSATIHDSSAILWGRTCAAHYFCGKYTQNILIFTIYQNGPSREHTLWPQKIVQNPLPSHKHGTINSTIQLAPTS